MRAGDSGGQGLLMGHEPTMGREPTGVRQAASKPHRDAGNQAMRQRCHAILSSLRRLYTIKKVAAEAQGLGSNEQEVLEELRDQEARQVAWLGPGKMFGELALLEDQPRSASITCMEDCAFLTIEGSDFERVLKRAMNEAVMSLPILVEPLLKELSFFQRLDMTVQQRIRHIVKYTVQKRGTVLFWQSDPPERCYVLLSGQVSCWRRGDSDGPSGYSLESEQLPCDAVSKKCSELATRLAQIAKDEDQEEKSRRLSESVYERYGQRRAMQRRRSMAEVMGFQEAVLREGAIFNDTALLADTPCEVTMTCDKDCQLLYIEKSSFDRVVKEEVIRLKVQELQLQVKRLFRGFPLFEEMGTYVQETVPDIVRYAFEPEGEVLFRAGEVAELCYIVLSGEVTIWKPMDQDAAEQGATRNLADMSQPLSRSSSKEPSRSSSKDNMHRWNSIESVSDVPEDRSVRASKSQELVFDEDDDEDDEDELSPLMGRAVGLSRAGSKDFLPSLGSLTRENNRDYVQNGSAPGLYRDSTKEVLPGLSALVSRHNSGKQEFDLGYGGEKDRPAPNGALPPVPDAQRTESKESIGFGSSSGEEDEGPLRPISIELPSTPPHVRSAKRPQLTRPHPEAYERCTQLASKLEPAARCLWRKAAPSWEREEVGSRGEVPMASLGPGSVFGEWALLNNNPRSATVTCHADCQFLVIEKCDFDRVVKQEMVKTKQEKSDFLQTYVPGMRQLEGRKLESMLDHFVRKTVPWNHVFVEQGEVGDGSIYFVSKGSVEFYTTNFPENTGEALLPEKGFRRLRVMIKGGVFGAVPLKASMSYTAVARSSPCEVLQVTMDHLKLLPEAVRKGLRKLLDQTMASQTAFPSQNAVSIVDPASRGASRGGRRPQGAGAAKALPSLPAQVPRPQSSKIPRPLSGKIPRPLDGKFPGLLFSKAAQLGSPLLGRKASPAGQPANWGGGLFRRESSPSDDLELLDVQPGEVLALRAHRPKRREEAPAPVRTPPVGLGKSVSLPSMLTAAKR